MITRRLPRATSTPWTCASCLRHPTTTPTSTTTTILSRRTIHRRPKLTHHDTFADKGIPKFMSAYGYDVAWTQQQDFLLRKLSALVADSPLEQATTKALVHHFARDPLNASLFNHASMAHNNHEFFSAFAPDPTPLAKEPALQASLEASFGSIDALRTTMLDTAAGMFGPGFVWLVWAPKSSLNRSQDGYRILSTYLAGTPYAEAGFRAQGLDTATASPKSYEGYMQAQQSASTGGPAPFGNSSARGQAQAMLPPGSTTVLPILCVSTWEHCWLPGWGVSGKRKYLADWWDAVDWTSVDMKTPQAAKTRPLRRGDFVSS